MATLIQSKQIEGVVTASVIDGSFTVKGQIIATGSDSIFGSITASSISSSGPIYGVRYDDVQGTPNFIGGSGISITQVGDDITIANLGAPELITSIDQLNSYTGSNDIIIVGLQSQINQLIAQTGSYETKGRGIVSGSSQIIEILQPLNVFSASQESKNTTLATYTASVDVNLTELFTSASDHELRVSALESFSASLGNGFATDAELQSLSSSVSISDGIQNNRLSALETYSASNESAQTIQDGRLSALETYSASNESAQTIQDGRLSSLENYSASNESAQTIQDGRLSSLENYSASNESAQTIQDGRLDELENFSSSIQAQVDALIRATSSYSTTDLTGSDSQTLSFNQVSNTLTIQGGNTVDLSSLAGGGTSGGSSIWTTGSDYYYVNADLQVTGSFSATSLTGSIDYSNLTNVPSGIVSSSDQILGGSGILSGSHTDISSLNEFTTSIEAKVDALINATSSYLTSDSDNQTLSIVGDQLTISGGNTVTIPTGSGGGVSSWNDLTDIPSGIVSSSEQVLGGSGVLSGSHTDISSLNDFTSSYLTDSASFDSRLNSIVHTQIPAGTISGSSQVILSDVDGFTSYSASVQQTIDNIVHTSIPSGTISGSQQISDLGFVTSSVITSEPTDITALNQFTASVETQVGEIETQLNDFSSSYLTDSASIDSRLTTLEGRQDLTGSDSQILTLVGDQLTISGGNTVTIPSGSGGGTSDFTQLTNVPSGLVSSSEQVLGGTGILSGSHTDISSLNDYTSSTDSRLSQLESFTSSLDATYATDSDLTSLSASIATELGNIQHTQIPSGTISGSSQLTSSFDTRYALSGSVGGASDVSFDGNRVISNEDLGDLFINQVNPGTSGSIQDFLNAVFYPNSGPIISTGNQTISEYVSSGTTIVTLSGTDPEGQPITWGTSSAYTDDLVRVASNGVMTLNALAESSSFNTDSVSGVHGHLVTVKATDSFNTSTEKDIYIIVTPNEAPKFRQTSVGGSVITSFTANLNENSTNGTLVGTIYFTDTEGDSITIYSSSIDNNHFVINKYPTYVQIVQNTGSLDYEQQTSYSFSISASDEHYEAGQDLDSITSLPITINVVDNQIPVVNNQTLSSINENSSNGATIDSIAASDNESDSITFLNFNLHKLLLDGSEVPSGSYGGTSQLTDPTENPFQMNSSGVVTRKSGVFLNSDLINSYQYRVQVKDNFNTSSDPAIITIPITDDTPATLSDNFGFTYIIESATSGTAIRTNSNGFSGTQADLNSNQSGTWSSSNSAISINSNGSLSLGVNLSGSVTQSGEIIQTTITFTNTFGTTTTQNVTALVTENQAPTATFTNQTSVFNTNQATDGTNLVSVVIIDTETDSPYQLSVSGTNGSSFTAVPQNIASSSWQLQANGDLSAGSYSYDVVVTDNFGKSTTYSNRTLTIASADTGTLSTNGTFYIIESATSGNLIRTSSNGRTGTQGQVSVSYSPNYGSQTATSFASSNPLITINPSTRLLSVGSNISGSGNVNGDVITSTITWTDQYGNNGSDDISVNVAKNNAPTVSGTSPSNLNTNQATGSSQVLQLQLSDVEGDSIPNSSLSFTNYNTTYFTPSISSPYMRLNVNNTSVPAGTYPYTASLQDIHGFETRVVSGSITISQASTGTLGGDTSIYIIESAQSGSVFRDATGYNQGNSAQLSVSYSPNYGSQVVQSYNSSNPAIVVDNNGNLTLGVDISGSVTQSGDTFNSTITFQDQYGNIGSGSVTATVFGNSAPSANFTATSPYDTDGAISGSTAGTLTVTDTENNSPYVITLGGTDGGKFDVQGSSSPFTIQPTGSLSAGTYSINITVTDNYGENVTLTNESIVVDAAVQQAKIYVYTLPIDGTYNNVSGITSAGSGTPPTPTISTAFGFFTSFVDSDTLGDSSITVQYGTPYTANLRGSASGADVDTILDGLGALTIGGSPASERIYIMIPDGAGLTGVPTSMTISDPGSSSTLGEYILFVSPDGTYQDSSGGLSNDIKTANIHKLTLDTPVDGYSDWIVIGTNDKFNNANAYVRLVPSSGSVPS